jgi:hypothetical protein
MDITIISEVWLDLSPVTELNDLYIDESLSSEEPKNTNFNPIKKA